MKTYIVDSFTTQPFKGNPAGVCLLQQAIEEQKMLDIANELGFSETAFILETDKEHHYAIRYFSPKTEIPLCGHATLASAKIIFGNTSADEIHFTTIENLDLLIKRQGDEIVMKFPVYNTVAAPIPTAALTALGITETVDTVYCNEKQIFVVQIADTALLAGLSPDYTALVQSCSGIRGVVVTAPSNEDGYDFHYRYFWPWSGTNEDPVTGGVQTFLAKYWADKLRRNKLKAFQSSARTGSMGLEVLADKVLLTGQAVVILEGELVI